MKDPTFLVIGAQKAGTTWLAAMLRQHPQIFVSEPKELHFWDKEARWREGMTAYRQHFDEAGPQHLAVGEATPNYFWTTPDPSELRAGGTGNERLPERIAAALPDLRLVVLLRDPVERAVSAYFHHIRQRRVRPGQSLLEVKDRYGIASMGYYDVHLERWWEHFDRERLLVLFYEETLGGDKTACLRRIHAHLGVDVEHQAHGLEGRHNPRRSDLFMRINQVSSWLAYPAEMLLPAGVRNHPRWRIEVGTHERAALREHFAPHDERLATMLGRSLPW